MGNWSWKGLDKSGKQVSGIINAPSEREARQTLRARNILVRSLTPPSILEFDIAEWITRHGFVKAFGKKELMIFTKQLSVMLNAGVPIMQTLETLHKSERNPMLKNTIRRIASDIREGKALGESLQSKKGFDEFYCSLIKAGEAGGVLDEILLKLAIHMEKEEKTKSQIKSAMSYPVIVLLISIGVIWGMMYFVVPQFVNMLTESGQEIPIITMLVIRVSDFFRDHTLIMVPIFSGIVIGLNYYLKTKNGKMIYDHLTMIIPLFSSIVVKGNLSSFCQTLSLLLHSGVTLIEAIDVCIKIISNSIIVRDLQAIKRSIEQGKNLAEPIMRIHYFPEIIGQMIKVGEQTGQIDSMLAKVGEVLEDEVNLLISSMTKLIEPIIIVVIGGIVVTILIAMYLPIFMTAGGGGEAV